MNTDFYDLLKTVADKHTFKLNLLQKNGELVDCKCLTMKELNQIIKAGLEDSSMRVKFYATISEIFKKSILTPIDFKLNILHRLLYILEARAESISPIKVFTHGDETVNVNTKILAEELRIQVASNIEWFSPMVFEQDGVSITCDIPLIETDLMMGEEYYKNYVANFNDANDIKLFIGQNFILELVKSISSISINDVVQEFSVLSIEERTKIVEQLPASVMQDVIQYNEKYKTIINECLSLEDFILPIEGSLFGGI